MISFENSFQTLPRFFYEPVQVLPLREARLLHVSPLKDPLGFEETPNEELKSWLNGELRLPGDQQIATRYAGHQFGVWAGQLGDGRAISLGEIITRDLGRQEIQIKGSGPTPFSRRGDGKAVLRSSIREYLCAEAMHALGVPTTRSLAILTGTGTVERETLEPEAIVARVFPTNVRFGHFEMAFHSGRKDELAALADYVRAQFYPGHSLRSMLEEVADRTARMIALWQAVGFCHGVMNTDNFSIAGITIDYGPFGFMEDFDPDHICNHSDHEGRYAYSRQPWIGLWNLERLLLCFQDLLVHDDLRAILDTYPVRFRFHLLKAYQEKLGLDSPLEPHLLETLLDALSTLRLDYTFFLRQLSSYEIGRPDSLGGLFQIYPDASVRTGIQLFLSQYDAALAGNSTSEALRIDRMKLKNPKWVLKNHIARSIIEAAEKGDVAPLETWFEILQNPFIEHPGKEAEAGPVPPGLKHLPVSCSS